MIVNLLFILIGSFLTGLSFVFPAVTLNNIWYIGPALRTTLISVVTIWNTFLITFPYAALPWNLFLFVVMPLEITLFVLRFVLGSRSPIHHNI